MTFLKNPLWGHVAHVQYPIFIALFDFGNVFSNNTTRIGFYQVFFIQKTLQIRVISEKTLQTSPRDFLEKNPPKSEKALGLFWKKPLGFLGKKSAKY